MPLIPTLKKKRERERENGEADAGFYKKGREIQVQFLASGGSQPSNK